MNWQNLQSLSKLSVATMVSLLCWAYAPVALSEDSAPVEAAEEIQPQTPNEVIQKATDEIVVAIEEAQEYFVEDPQRFHAEIDRILFPIVDFRSFARGVMGKYGSRRYEASLTDQAAKDEFQSQVERFTASFKRGLVATYAKGLLTFQGEKIEVLPPAKKAKAGKNVIVVQRIHSAGSDPVQIRYKMRQNADAEWKVRNVTLSSVNLGKVYSNQFASAAKLHKGDIDKVIEEWVVDSQDIEE